MPIKKYGAAVETSVLENGNDAMEIISDEDNFKVVAKKVERVSSMVMVKENLGSLMEEIKEGVGRKDLKEFIEGKEGRLGVLEKLAAEEIAKFSVLEESLLKEIKVIDGREGKVAALKIAVEKLRALKTFMEIVNIKHNVELADLNTVKEELVKRIINKMMSAIESLLSDFIEDSVKRTEFLKKLEMRVGILDFK